MKPSPPQAGGGREVAPSDPSMLQAGVGVDPTGRVRAGALNDRASITANPVLFAAIFQQNWENARHIKSERIWFMNVYSIITAGILSLLHGIRGALVLEYALVVFMCVFSIIGLLTSFRLKAELEECLEKLQALTLLAEAGRFVALGQSEGALTRYPKFRWIFPVFYSIATVSFMALLVARLVAGLPAVW